MAQIFTNYSVYRQISSLYRIGIHIHAESNQYHKTLDSCKFVPFVSFLWMCTQGSLAKKGGTHLEQAIGTKRN
ncbi:hypothetical protein [Flavivirga sp. 57AJ16]|uniref:hypothetical protein n=1 Tax=Flavivirga sp. 57AJ16 TaxID=3025307 RepID=UPI0023657FF5|nr:hypothetical protein [Flavivirga sp. 57AJ16]MDD7886883.1 hypothetical protein [Flavivirga sp. 57AJ16]